MCRLPGFRFAPRIRGLKENRLYLLPGMIVPPGLASLVAGAINVRVIGDRWSEPLRLAMPTQARGLSPAKRSGPGAASS